MKNPFIHRGFRGRQGRARSAALAAAGGVALGAGVMYLFDPERGARRRGVLRDKITSAARRLARQLDRAARDVRNRTGRLPAVGGVSVFREPAPERGGRPHVQLAVWAPARRLMAGVAGAGLVLYGIARGTGTGILAGAAGAGLVARTFANLGLRRLLGLGGRRGVDLRKTMTIHAPVEHVYAFWADLENFPRIMSHVRDVKRIGPDRFRWKVDGPAGIAVEWDAIVTKCVPNAFLSWKSEEGSAIRQAGAVRFEPQPDGATRLDIKLSYNPPLGAIGHTVASLLGADPKSMIDHDLVRFKSLMETGKTRAHDRPVRIEELGPPEPLTAEAGASHVGR